MSKGSKSTSPVVSRGFTYTNFGFKLKILRWLLVRYLRLGVDIKNKGGWLIVAGVALVLFGAAGSRFSFGVFLKPLTEEFFWSRGSLSGALAIAGVATGSLRPIAGMLADRYDARIIAVSGLVLGGMALIGLAGLKSLWQFYVLFFIMGLGFTLASPATLTRLISARFSRHRGLALSLAGSGSAIGETALVPLSAVVVAMSGWRSAYIVLGLLMLIVLIPASSLLMSSIFHKNNDISPDEPDDIDQDKTNPRGFQLGWVEGQGLGLRQATRTPIFWALTVGFFT